MPKILYSISLILMLSLVRGNVISVCDKCGSSCRKLVGVIDQQLSFTYRMHKRFTLLTIKYNDTNKIDVTPSKTKHQSRRDTRLSVSNVSSYGNYKSIQISLVNLTWQDNNLAFTYLYRDENLDTCEGVNRVEVRTILVVDRGRIEAKKSPLSFSTIVIIGAVSVMVLVSLTALAILCKRGIPERNKWYSVGNQETSPSQKISMDEPIYACPRTSDTWDASIPPSDGQTDYAELGPGGRIDKPEAKPKKSIYAQVKTDDVNYPTLGQDTKGKKSVKKNSKNLFLVD